MASALPTELIELIFSSADHTDKHACANICLTNKIGYRAATPHLYYSIDFGAPGRGRKERSTRMMLLCRTLLTNRALAQHVLQIQFHLDQEATIYKFDPRSLLGYQAVNRVIGTELQVPLIVQDMLIGQPGEQLSFNEETLMAILAIICPRVESLRMTLGFTIMRTCVLLDQVIDFVGDPLPQTHGLYNVQSVYLEAAPNRSGVNAGDIVTILRLPNLRSLHVSHLTGHPMTTEEHGRNIRSSLCELKINHCSANDDDMTYFLRNCTELRRLEVEWSSERGAHQVNWRELGQHITASLPHLVYLGLTYLDGENANASTTFTDGGRCLGPLLETTSLFGFDGLKHLASLETLELPNFLLVQKEA